MLKQDDFFSDCFGLLIFLSAFGIPNFCQKGTCRNLSGVTALAESLQKNRSLQYLALDNNQISQQLGKSCCMVGTSNGQTSAKQLI